MTLCEHCGFTVDGPLHAEAPCGRPIREVEGFKVTTRDGRYHGIVIRQYPESTVAVIRWYAPFDVVRTESLLNLVAE